MKKDLIPLPVKVSGINQLIQVEVKARLQVQKWRQPYFHGRINQRNGDSVLLFSSHLPVSFLQENQEVLRWHDSQPSPAINDTFILD